MIDPDGNAVAMTATIEAAFGSRVMAAGFLLNNQLTDFSFLPRDPDGRLVANPVDARQAAAQLDGADAGVRPRRQARWRCVGSPGGSRIILYVVKAIVALIDWEMDAQQAAAAANFGSRGRTFEIEGDPALPTEAIAHAMRNLGHSVLRDEMVRACRSCGSATMGSKAAPIRGGRICRAAIDRWLRQVKAVAAAAVSGEGACRNNLVRGTWKA